ncbi:MAG: DUF924 family protein [Gammaproteobacteria bacterium]
MPENPESVIRFWFGDASESPATVASQAGLWFGGDPSFDELIRSRFDTLLVRASAGELAPWQKDAQSSLALTLILDQFPRNLYRGRPQSFDYDAQALEVATRSIERGFDAELSALQATFLYLPLEHAENAEVQERCVTLFRALLVRAPVELRPQFESFLAYAIRHQKVIDQFGRFPHRNEVLKRHSTTEELSYLAAGGDAF